MKVFVLGYSDKKDRYSNMAYNSLKAKGHQVVGINPLYPDVEPSLDIAKRKYGSPHTLTVYLRPEISNLIEPSILKLSPKRVIFNPDTENPSLEEKLKKKGIEVLHACTLVLLQTDQF